MCCSMAYQYPTVQYGGKVLADGFSPIYYCNAFERPFYPVIISPEKLVWCRWGLIPDFCISGESARSMARRTVNARSETVFTRPAFRASARKRRALIPATGFYEWHDQAGKKYPFFIVEPNRRPFFLAGIWNPWFCRATEETVPTFAVLTTEANRLLAKVHNLKKRMPVILSERAAAEWLAPTTPLEEFEGSDSILAPYNGELDAWPVAKINPKFPGNNRPETQAPYVYPGLDWN